MDLPDSSFLIVVSVIAERKMFYSVLRFLFFLADGTQPLKPFHISAPSPTTLPVIGRYSHLVPTSTTFHAYISLLSVHSCSSEIPLTLAWMCALQIKPQRKTLLLALVQFSEIAAAAPIVASWSGEESGEYEKLKSWLRMWLRDSCPTETDVAKARMSS